MKLWKKLVIVLGAIITLLVAIILVFLQSFTLFDCSNEIKKEYASPSNKYTATLFYRDCGATTKYATVISLRYGVDEFLYTKEDVIASQEGKSNITIEWDSNNVLRIFESRDNLFAAKTFWDGVKIEYVY